MGAKPSIKIETPDFIESQWEYQPPQNQSYPDYGMFRTLSNKKTGDMIDEFDMCWANQEEYSYYLKSFNWRYNQPTVVNTRYIVQKSKHEFCAQTYVARVYIEHVIVRLSEINDIPYPQNLYVLMEALQGYAKIFEHSKYFVIEENQICVDSMGNVKIWINSDLSINYPNSDQFGNDKNAGEQKMVERLVHLIAENTDKQSEPQLTFLEYFQERKGFKGKKFEEARVLVLNYARLNETQIPDKFEAVLNLADEEQQTVQENQNVQQEFTGRPLYDRQVVDETSHWDTKAYTSQRFQSEGYRSNAHPIAVIPPPMPIQQVIQPLYGGQYQLYSPQNNSSVSFCPKALGNMGNMGNMGHMVYGGYPAQQSPTPTPAPVQYIPHYTRIEYPVKVINHPQFIISPRQNVQPPQVQIYPQTQQQQKSSNFVVQPKQDNPKHLQLSRREINQQLRIAKNQSKSKLNDVDSSVDIRVSPLTVGEQIRVTLYNDPQNFIQPTLNHQRNSRDSQESQNIVDISSNYVVHKQNNQNGTVKRIQNHQNSSSNYQNLQFSDVDDLLAKSLPIKAGYPASTKTPLINGFEQSQRSAFSHINTNQHVDSFGLKVSGQFIMKDENDKGRKRKGRMASTIVKVTNKPVVKYYYSLEDELQIDPDIAADMERYLAT